MGRCKVCAGFPWVPGTDLSSVPPVKCDESKPARKFTQEGIELEHDLPCFIPRPKTPRQVAKAGGRK